MHLSYLGQILFLDCLWASLVAQMPAMQESQVSSLDWG